MSNELTINGSIALDDSEGSEFILAVSDFLASMATKKFVHEKMSVTTSEVAINLGGVTSLGWGVFRNLDESNYVELRTGTGATKFAKLVAGAIAVFQFGSGITAPYAIADTAACQMEYAIFSL